MEIIKILSKANGQLPEWAWVLALVGFFGIIVVGVILVKKYFKPLQINKPDVDEKEAAKEELDRILVPIEDEDLKKQMDEAAKKDGE